MLIKTVGEQDWYAYRYGAEGLSVVPYLTVLSVAASDWTVERGETLAERDEAMITLMFKSGKIVSVRGSLALERNDPIVKLLVLNLLSNTRQSPSLVNKSSHTRYTAGKLPVAC